MVQMRFLFATRNPNYVLGVDIAPLYHRLICSPLLAHLLFLLLLAPTSNPTPTRGSILIRGHLTYVATHWPPCAVSAESHSWPDSLEELLRTAAAVPRRSANAADAEAEALIHADASGGWWGPNPSTDGATAAALAATAFNVAALEAALGPGLVRAFPSLQGLLEGMLRAEAAITRGTAALFTLRSAR